MMHPAAVQVPSDALRVALRDTLPHAVALIPFSLAIGAAAVANGLSSFEAIAGAFALLAGSAQLAAIELVGNGTGVVLTAFTILMINLRFTLYGAGVNRWFADASRGQRMLLAFPIVDQTFLVCEHRFTDETQFEWRRRYYLTATSMLVCTFVTAQVIGYRVGASLPDELGLHMAAPLVFAGMLGKMLAGRRQLVTCGVAAVVVVIAAGLPGGLALPVAAVAGLVAGSTIRTVES